MYLFAVFLCIFLCDTISSVLASCQVTCHLVTKTRRTILMRFLQMQKDRCFVRLDSGRKFLVSVIHRTHVDAFISLFRLLLCACIIDWTELRSYIRTATRYVSVHTFSMSVESVSSMLVSIMVGSLGCYLVLVINR